MQDFLSYTIRIILVYIFTYFGTRVLSKKSIAQMSAYEVAGLMILANVAAEPLVNKVLTKSVFGAGLIVALIFLSARLALINKLTPVFEHTPSLIINNGQINLKALKDVEMTINQFLGLLRQQGYDKIDDVSYAILEAQGNLSVFPKTPSRPLQVQDMGVQAQPKALILPAIMDGLIVKENLKFLGLNDTWLLSQLESQGVSDYKKEVSLALVDSSQNLMITKK